MTIDKTTIDEAVSRFLAWPIPEDFSPDGGINIDRRASTLTGTNLFHAGQARAMLEHCLGVAVETPKDAPITPPVLDPGPDSLEREIAAKADAAPRWAAGEAPRVTKEMVDAQIIGETYTVLPSGRVTVCELTLANGFTVRGESAVVFIENNVPQIGREIARENAVDQIWQLLGFRLRDKLAV